MCLFTDYYTDTSANLVSEFLQTVDFKDNTQNIVQEYECALSKY